MKRFITLVMLLAAVFGIVASANASGLTGYYYNLSSSHPDMEQGITGLAKGYVQTDLTGNMPSLTTTGQSAINQWDWWTSQYLAFTRTDSQSSLQNGFDTADHKWFPVTGVLNGDPHDFAVHWTGTFYVDQDKKYLYSMGSDDDSWLFIDKKLVLDLGGIHAMSYEQYELFLTQGMHTIDIFFAERHVTQSGFQLNFFSDLQPNPVPEPCTMILLGSGLASIAAFRRKFKRS